MGNSNPNYKKSYKNDLFFFIPYVLSETARTFDELHIKSKESEIAEAYIDIVHENATYECTNYVAHQMERVCLGRHRFACLDDDYDGTVLAYEDAEFVLTLHDNSSIGVLAVIIPDNEYDTTQLEDQMSSKHMEIFDEATGGTISINDYMLREFHLEACGDPKCMVCMSNEPDEPMEMAYILAAEAYNSAHIDYRIVNRDVLDWRQNNKAKYDYYDAYMSDSTIAFVMKDYPDDFTERLEIEGTYLFIVELTVFQHAAVTRTNMRIVEELDCPHGTDLDFVQELYDEFGRTIRFWEQDNFKYPMAQCEADEISRAFGTWKIMETYNRNQNYLERIIELRDAKSNERENRTLNATVLIMTLLQVATVVTGTVQWVGSKGNWSGEKIEAASVLALASVCLLVGLIMLKMWGRSLAIVKKVRKWLRKSRKK